MDKTTLIMMLCSVNFTPDEAENIVRYNFREALKIYHQAKKHDASTIHSIG